MTLLSMHAIQILVLLSDKGKKDRSMIVKWVSDKVMTPNDGKYHLLVFDGNRTETTITNGNSKSKESNYYNC